MEASDKILYIFVMTIRWKLTILFFAIAVVPIVLIAALTFNHYKSSLENLRLLQLENLATLKTEEIETHFAKLKTDIALVQATYNIKVYFPLLDEFKKTPSDPAYVAAKKALDVQLKKTQKILNLRNILLLNTNGEVVYENNPGPTDLPTEEIRSKAYQEGRNKIYLSDVFVSHVGMIKMLMTAPVFSSNDVFLGVIAFDFDLHSVSMHVKNVTGLGKTGEILVATKIGNELQFLHPLKYDQKAPFRKHPIYDQKELPIQQAVQGIEGTGQKKDYRGVSVVAVWKYIPSLDWGIVAKIDTTEAFYEIVRLENYIALISVAVLVFSGIGAYFLAQTILGPIKQLSKGAEIIGSGNLDYRIAMPSKDEIGDLSRVLAKMTGDLKHSLASRDELNQQLIERKALETQLELRGSALQAAANGVVITNRNGIIQWVNEATTRLTGYSSSEIIGQTPRLFKSGKQDLEFYRNLWNTILAGREWHGELVNKRKDGTLYDEELTITPIRNLEGVISHFIAITQDVTQRKESEKKLKQSNEDLEQFAHIVSHDLQEPLRTIAGFSEIIEKKETDRLDPETLDYFHHIREATQRMSVLIRNLLTYAKVRREGTHLRPVPLDEVLNEVEKDLQSQIKESKAVIHKQVAHETVLAEETQLRQVLQNLISNALKYRQGEKPPEIQIQIRDQSNKCIISVKDNGIGFDPKYKNDIFKMFSRIHSKDKYTGTGIGLATCKKIIERHGGRIWVETEPNKGSTFSFSLTKTNR